MHLYSTYLGGLRQIRGLDMDIAGNALLMFALAAATIVSFNMFNAPLRRTMAEQRGGGGVGNKIWCDARHIT
jgi:hypothetical protein